MILNELVILLPGFPYQGKISLLLHCFLLLHFVITRLKKKSKTGNNPHNYLRNIGLESFKGRDFFLILILTIVQL